MRKLSNWFYRVASGRTLLLAFGLYLVFPAIILSQLEERMNTLAGRQIGPIDLLFFETSTERIFEMVEAYGPEGRRLYALGEVTADLAYPLVYTFLFGVMLSLLYRGRLYVPFRYVNVVPVGVLLFDLLENTCIVTLLLSYPTRLVGIAQACLVFTALKWVLVLLLLVLLLYGLVRLALQKITTRTS